MEIQPIQEKVCSICWFCNYCSIIFIQTHCHQWLVFRVIKRVWRWESENYFFPCVYSNQLLFIHYLCCWGGPGSCLIERVLGVRFLGQYLYRVPINPLLHPCKPPDTIMNCDDSHISGLKIILDILIRIDVFTGM